MKRFGLAFLTSAWFLYALLWSVSALGDVSNSTLEDALSPKLILLGMLGLATLGTFPAAFSLFSRRASVLSLLKLLGIFALAAAISMILSPAPFFSGLVLFQMVLIAITTLSIVALKRSYLLPLRLIAITALVHAAIALALFLATGWTNPSSGPFASDRLGGLLHPVHLGLLAAIGAIYFGWRLTTQRAALPSLVALGVLLLALLLSGTRVAAVAVMAGLVTTFAASKNHFSVSRRRALNFALIGIGIVLVASEPIVTSWITRGLPTGNVLSINGRISIWESAFELWLQRPWLGWGPGAVRTGLITVDGAVVDSTHSTLLEILVETGAVGFIAFSSLWLTVLVRAWRQRARSGTSGLLPGIGIAISVIMVTENAPLGGGPIAMTTFVVIGAVAVLQWQDLLPIDDESLAGSPSLIRNRRYVKGRPY